MGKSYAECEVTDGETHEIPGWQMKFCCCDCGLIHFIQFSDAPKNFRSKKKGKLFMRVWRDNRATGQHRRWKKK